MALTDLCCASIAGALALDPDYFDHDVLQTFVPAELAHEIIRFWVARRQATAQLLAIFHPQLAVLPHLNLSWCLEFDLSLLASTLSVCADNLVSLNLSGQPVRAEHLRAVEGCTNLGEFRLHKSNHVTDDALGRLIPSLSKLHTLELSLCKPFSVTTLTNLLAVHVGTRLRYLDVSWTGVNDSDLDTLAEACGANLESLYVAFCKSLVDLSHVWPRLPSLRKIDLTQTDLYSPCLESLADHCPHLEVVALNGTLFAISPEHVENLGRLENLAALDFSECPALLGRYATMASLFPAGERGAVLRIRLSNSKCSARALLLCLSNCPNVQDLDLGECPKVNPQVGHAIAAHCQRLTQLNLTACYIGGDPARAIFRHCTQLVDLNLSQTDIPADSFEDLALLTRIEKLDVSGTEFGNRGLSAVIGDACPRLTRLSASGCQNVTDQPERKTWTTDRLVYLSLYGTAVSDSTVQWITMDGSLPQLKSLYLQGTLIGDESIRCLGASPFRLEHLSISTCVNVSNMDALTSMLKYHGETLKGMYMNSLPIVLGPEVAQVLKTMPRLKECSPRLDDLDGVSMGLDGVVPGRGGSTG